MAATMVSFASYSGITTRDAETGGDFPRHALRVLLLVS
jgi:hypothetical protein